MSEPRSRGIKYALKKSPAADFMDKRVKYFATKRASNFPLRPIQASKTRKEEANGKFAQNRTLDFNEHPKKIQVLLKFVINVNTEK